MQENVVSALSRERYERLGIGTPEVFREYPFAVREKDVLMTGKFDRLVIGRRKGKAVFAEVLDFKTDRPFEEGPDPAAGLVEEYTPQIQAYRKAASSLFRLERSEIYAKLVFVRFPGGLVREVPAD